MAQFLYYAVLVTGQAINMLITYAVWFMTPLKIALIFIFLVVYGTRQGLKVLARINVLAFFALSAIILSSVIAFRYGNLLNLQPVFGSGLGNLVKGSVTTAFAYANMEILLILHPYVRNKKRIIRLALVSTSIITFFYIWSVFTTTFYLGPDIVPKSFWPFYFVTESVKIPVINNFRLILMLIWTLVIYKSVSTEYFMSALIMNSITGVSVRKWCIILSPFLLFLPLLFPNEVVRRDFADLVTPGVTIFNLIYITFIALLAAIKGTPALKSNRGRI